MTERIKELILECVDFRLDPDSNAYEAQVCPEDLECIVELVVRESVRLLEEDDGATHHKELLFEHFGVE